MLRVSFKKILPRFKVQREEFAHWVIGMRKRTVDSIRERQPLFPLMQEQQQHVLGLLRETSRELLDIHSVKTEEVIVYEAGSYSKGTCTIGSDLDLNVAYAESDFRRLYAFEKNLINIYAYLLHIGKSEIHNNNLNMAIQNKAVMEALPQALIKSRAVRRAIITKLVGFFHKRGIFTLAGKELRDFISWAALREPEVIAAFDKMRVSYFLRGSAHLGYFLDKIFLFGCEEQFSQIDNGIRTAIDLELAREKAPFILDKFSSSMPKNLKGSATAAEAKNLDEAQYFIKKGYGYRAGFQLLFIMGLALKKEEAPILHSYTDYMQEEGIAEVLGKNLRDELFNSLDWLLKARAVVSIFSNGGIESPTIGTLASRPDYSSPGILEGVLGSFNHSDFPAFIGNIQTHQDIIKRAIMAAEQGLSWQIKKWN